MEQKIINLYNDYDLGLMDRRDFLAKLAFIAGGTVAGYSLLSLLQNDYTCAEIISKDDPRIQTESITYPGATGDIHAYLATPRKEVKVPGVVVIHEIYGLNPHIEDVARRLAAEDFIAIAPDALSPVGGTPEDSNKAFAMVRELDGEATHGQGPLRESASAHRGVLPRSAAPELGT